MQRISALTLQSETQAINENTDWVLENPELNIEVPHLNQQIIYEIPDYVMLFLAVHDYDEKS